METTEEYGVVPDVGQGPITQVPGSFARPPHFPHGMQMAEHHHPAYLGVNPYAPKPFAFENTGHRLTASQQSELEMARKRAEKAAEGKRANQTAVRRAKRRASRASEHARDNSDHDAPGSSDGDMHNQQRDEIEAKLATVEDEKEAKRLKRLLRNRVSAQQARERKKSYVHTLEGKSMEQEEALSQLEARVKVLERENVMLRSVIKNMKGETDEDPAAAQQQAPQNGAAQR
ncbi:hypothetical protein WJX73_001694 [Symbiochloris irregularis]|uniref:BZIP domain-containing protein n=1 Tax=Symbiochloris irregularis TaxID=706552 RepID=A0AAW1NS49_9CHLO